MNALRLGLAFAVVGASAWLLLARPRQVAERPLAASHEEFAEGSPDLDSADDLLAGSFEMERGALQTAADGASNANKPAPAMERVEPGSIQGCLYDQGGAPLPKAELRLVPPHDPLEPREGVHTARDGCFLFKSVPPGEWWICWRPRGSETSTKLAVLTVREGQREIVTLMLAGSRSVSGRITMGDGWSEDLDKTVVQLELSPARGPDAGKLVSSGVAQTNRSEPERSGVFTLAGLQPDIYVLKAIPFIEGDHLAIEVDLLAGDVTLEPIVIGPETPLRPPR